MFHRFWKPSHARIKKDRNGKVMIFCFPFPIFYPQYLYIFTFCLFVSATSLWTTMSVCPKFCQNFRKFSKTPLLPCPLSPSLLFSPFEKLPNLKSFPPPPPGGKTELYTTLKGLQNIILAYIKINVVQFQTWLVRSQPYPSGK